MPIRIPPPRSWVPSTPRNWPQVDQIFSVPPCGTDDDYRAIGTANRQSLIPIDLQGLQIQARRMYMMCRAPLVAQTFQFAFALYRLNGGYVGPRGAEFSGGAVKNLELVPGTLGTLALVGDGANYSIGALTKTFSYDINMTPDNQYYVAASADDGAAEFWLPGYFGASASPNAAHVVGAPLGAANLVSFSDYPQQQSPMMSGVSSPVMPFVCFRSARGIYIYGGSTYDT